MECRRSTDRAWWAALQAGTADDEAGIAHVAAFWARHGRPPVGVTVEGREEIQAAVLGRLLAAHRDTGSPT